jgi:hypothetical protein
MDGWMSVGKARYNYGPWAQAAIFIAEMAVQGDGDKVGLRHVDSWGEILTGASIRTR